MTPDNDAADLALLALDLLDEGLVIVGGDGRVIRTNSTLQTFFPCRPDELVGDDISGVIARYMLPALGESGAGQIRAALMDGADGGTFTCRTPDPPHRHLSVSISRLNNATQARLIRFHDAGDAEDVRQFRIALDHSPVVVFAQDRNLRYFWTYNQQHGLTNEGVLGATDDDLFSPADAARLIALKRRVLETGEIVREEVPLTLGGVARVRSLTLEPLRDISGSITGVSGAAYDITTRVRAEEALRESEERFRSIFEAAGIGIVLLNMTGRVVRSNPAFRRMLGYTEDELVGLRISDFTHPDDLEESLSLCAGMATGLQDRFELENRYVSRDGRTIHGRLTATLLRNAAGKPHLAIGMVEEITERKLHEEIRQQAYRQIERNMEQFAILGDHVRHPLQVILARADLMDDEETAEQIREQVRRINALIRQLDEGWVESRKIREFLRRNDLL